MSKSIFHFFLLAVILLINSACSTTPVSKFQAKQISADKQESYRVRGSKTDAILTIIRDSGFLGSGCDTDILIDNKRAGQIGPGEFIELFLKPGEYVLGANPRGVCVGTLLEQEVILKANEDKSYRIGIGGNGNMNLMRTAL